MADLQTKTTPSLNTSAPIKDNETRDHAPTMHTLPRLPKEFDAPTSPNSLNSLLARSSYRAKTAAASPSPTKIGLSLSPKKTDKEVADLYGYGYGYGPDEGPGKVDQCSKPQGKRRKYQRRNSKTPRMLMGDSGALVRDALRELDELPSLAPKSGAIPFLDLPSIGSSTDNYLNIVEDIVSQVQKRRRSSKST